MQSFLNMAHNVRRYAQIYVGVRRPQKNAACHSAGALPGHLQGIPQVCKLI